VLFDTTVATLAETTDHIINQVQWNKTISLIFIVFLASMAAVTGPGPSGSARVFVLFGVAGCGKTTLGKALTDRLNGVPDRTRESVFLDADDYHDEAAIEKMRRGVALSEQDRAPWLARVREAMVASAAPLPSDPGDTRRPGRDVIVACSALKRSHRAFLWAAESQWLGSVKFAHLRVSESSRDILASRLEARARTGSHFFNPKLLKTQLATLELDGSEQEIETGGEVPIQDAVDALWRVFLAIETKTNDEKTNDDKTRLWQASLLHFMDAWYEKISVIAKGLASEVDSDTTVIDHACFRCSTETQYWEVLFDLQEMGHTIAGASVIGGREITTVKLNPPITWRMKKIQAIEVPMPKPGRPKKYGWEHAEVALMEGTVGCGEVLGTFMKKHPEVLFDAKGLGKEINKEISLDLGDGLAVKFHNRPLLEVVAWELGNGTATIPGADGTVTLAGVDGTATTTQSNDATETTGKKRKNISPDEELIKLFDFGDPSCVFGLEVREPFVSRILAGTKTLETRGYPLPEGLIGKQLVLLAALGLRPGESQKSAIPDEAPIGAALVVGTVTFDWAVKCTYWAFPKSRHRVRIRY
jgi:gluconokinase